MNPTTAAMLQELEQASWFANVGRIDMPNVAFVKNWLAAIAGFVSSEWENVRLDTLNILRQKVLSQNQVRFNQWNNHVRSLKPSLNDLIRRKSETIVRQEKLPMEFIGNIYTDFLGVAMEAEYSDVVPSGFYSIVILDCYLKGHIPCGWEGDFPQGRLIVY